MHYLRTCLVHGDQMCSSFCMSGPSMTNVTVKSNLSPACGLVDLPSSSYTDGASRDEIRTDWQCCSCKVHIISRSNTHDHT